MGLKRLGRCGDDIGADIHGMLRVDFDGQGKVFVVGFFDHARNAHKINLFGKGKPAGNRRSRQYQDIDIRTRQMGRNGHGASNMAQPIGVVGVH